LPLLDLTSLEEDDTAERIEALCGRAVTAAGPVAAVCIRPCFVSQARQLLEDRPVRVATVVNFPAGTAAPAAVAAETRAAVDDGADEIDVVLPYRAYAAGDRAQAIDLLRACRDACDDRALMKVILETGALREPGLIERASFDAIAAGADFLKTSTGKLKPAATLEAAAVMLRAIRDSGRPIGFKAAGGIRDTAGAAGYLALADAIMGAGWTRVQTFRFGASGLLDALLADLGLDPEPRTGTRSGAGY
jgi:deoxyribose-phosphate aldolase